MKLFDYILLSLAVVFFIIGVDQVIRLNQEIIDTYWIFMMTAACLIWLNLRRTQQKEVTNQNKESNTKKKSSRPTQPPRK